jgi:hypothetical protein
MWRGISPETSLDAELLLEEIQGGHITIQGEVIEVTGVGTEDSYISSRPW